MALIFDINEGLFKADPPKTLRGGVHPNPTERYMRPLGNQNRPSDTSMPIFEMSGKKCTYLTSFKVICKICNENM